MSLDQLFIGTLLFTSSAVFGSLLQSREFGAGIPVGLVCLFLITLNAVGGEQSGSEPKP